MSDQYDSENKKAWLIVDQEVALKVPSASYTLVLPGQRALYSSLTENDWALTLNLQHNVTRVGRVLRLRSSLEHTTIYLDRMQTLDPAVPIAGSGLEPPSEGGIGLVKWSEFVQALAKLASTTIDDVPAIKDHSYVR